MSYNFCRVILFSKGSDSSAPGSRFPLLFILLDGIGSLTPVCSHLLTSGWLVFNLKPFLLDGKIQILNAKTCIVSFACEARERQSVPCERGVTALSQVGCLDSGNSIHSGLITWSTYLCLGDHVP